MKTCIYTTDPKIKARIAEQRKTDPQQIGVMLDMIDNEFNLPHDDLARAMYVALACGTDDDANIETLLSVKYENLLRNAYLKSEIGRDCLDRWMSDSQIASLDKAKENADK